MTNFKTGGECSDIIFLSSIMLLSRLIMLLTCCYIFIGMLMNLHYVYDSSSHH